MYSIKLIHNAVMELRKTQGSKAKREALVRHMYNTPELLSFLVYCYDPRRSYYQSQLNMNAIPRMLVGKVESYDSMEPVYDVLDRMNDKEILGKAGASALCKVALGMTPEGRELIQILLDRDIKAGMAEKSINKAYNEAAYAGKLIDTVPYQRYGDMTIEKLRLMDFSRGVYSQLKSDGMFGNIIIRNERDPQLLSRSGSPISGPSVQGLLDYVQNIAWSAGVGNFVLHGELLVWDKVDRVILKRAVGNGLINSIIQTGLPIDSRYVVEYRVWDLVPYDKWFESEKVDTPYQERFGLVQDMFDDEPANEFVRVQESKVVHSFKEAVEHLKELLARKEEGTIWKPFDMPWEDGTSEYGMKGKLEMECELEIIGFKDGDQKGKHAKTFGSIMMQSACGKLKVNVSGMPDDIRKMIHDNREQFIKGIATVRSNGVQDKTGDEMKSLFLPRLIEHRSDRLHADSLERIYEIQESTINNIQKLVEEK